MNEKNSGPRELWVKKIEIEAYDDEEYYRIYGEGPRQRKNESSGCYVLMPKKPSGKGEHPAPEAYHRTSKPNPDYREKTSGAITDLEMATKR